MILYSIMVKAIYFVGGKCGKTPHRRLEMCSSVIQIWNAIGVLDRSHFSVYIYKVSQDFLCGRKQAEHALLSFVRASTVVV